jgi:signal transduction histidine kinase/CheY-like chemotaxis protein
MVLMSMALADRIYYINVQHREAEAEKEDILRRNRYLQEQERLHAKENEAIMKTTQMLAHDVRKPFSILRMGLTMLLNNKEIERMPDLLAKMLPEVDRAAKAADGLIADVMEIGSSQQLVFEDICPTELIRGTLYEAFRIYPSSDIQIEFDSQHTHEIRANAAKLQRVFTNIYTNALQAMGASGHTWFRTRNIRLKGRAFVEFCIGNSGSFIPAENIGKIFEAFFTDGKASGTGLGLAISRKVVAAHGGSIWCESSKSPEFPNGKVQFFFTIPASIKAANKARLQFPTQSKDYTAAVFAVSDPNESNGFRSSIAQQELELEGAIIATAAELGRRLQIVLIDDEAIYIEALRQDFRRSGKLAESICIGDFRTAGDALKFIASSKTDLIICDIDMGRESIDGFELVRRVRDQDGSSTDGSFICLHSNRMVADDHRLAILSGADAFITKPAARAQILKLLLQAAQRANDSHDEPTAAGGDDIKASSPEVAIIEDNPFIAEAWSATLLPDAVAHFANSPEEFLSQISSDGTLLERLVCVVVDQHFDQSSSDGLSLARFIKAQRPDLRVLLSSDGYLTDQETDGAIDRQISKTPVKLNRLLR